MPMKDSALEGSLAQTSFPRLLFELWEKELSGRLHITNAAEEKSLFFEKGQVVVEKESLSVKNFLAALAKKKVLLPEQTRECERHARSRKISRIKALGELGLLSPLPLWNLMGSFFTRRLFSFFDLAEGRFSFESGAALAEGRRFDLLQSPELILQGIRQMQNFELMENHIPDEDAPIYISTPYFLHLLGLEPYEKYVLRILRQAPRLKIFYKSSELAKKENQKVLFAFICLGILSVPEKKPKSREPREQPEMEQGKILEALTEKCAYIYKYVSKEIGPVAQNVISKCLEEIKPGLGPLFQKMELLPDGRIEVDSAMRQSANLLPEELFKSLVKGYDDILAAEVLAVKKSLGGVHETSLVKNLEKIGCL